ncbi:hypothetical protein K461DRAFT_277083 [Myriangium duriaei CBS 260.36]|uniref:LisH domain-containing protein n=1 Tax=Myriangium duriaei CBS 260.36 TaxID=1168546 RepID=A0A9P4MI84_9PEZI|nr:hypothetical protein K461DRAFT_277083 [Myriangium duriaei CBS 260.36]
MGDGSLGSDHVNYLVLRYLQESGFEDSAKSLYREWHRHDQFRDPEAFPFAPVVKQQELVHIIQDGLFHDQMQAAVAGGTRRFYLTSSDLDFSTPGLRNATKPASRRQSAYAPQDRDEFPLPPPKRIRQSNASDVITNGDAMDVDERADDEDRDSNVSDQDRAQSEPEPREELPVIETKVAATQTDKRKRLKTNTVYWTLDKTLPTAILHTSWNPTSDAASLLLTAGESICRTYNLSPPDGQSIEGNDVFELSADHVVTAAAWHPDGQYFTCAVKGTSQSPGMVTGNNYMLDIDVSGVSHGYDDFFDMITLSLRYSKSGKTLFAASTDGSRSILEARDISSQNHRNFAAAYVSVEDNVILEVACISDSTFAVCGKGLVSIWSLSPVPHQDHSTPQSLVQSYTHSVPKDIGFDKIRYDHRHGILIATASSSGDICTLRRDGDTAWVVGPEIETPPSAGPIISAIAFQPFAEDADLEIPSRLAVAFETGEVAIYHVSTTECSQQSVLTIGPQELPLALAWAPSKDLEARLAAASDEAIKIWDVAQQAPKELLAWKAAPASWYQGDDNHLPDDEDAQTEPTLSWDIGGEKLAFAVGRKVAIVSIEQDAEIEVNGSK